MRGKYFPQPLEYIFFQATGKRLEAVVLFVEMMVGTGGRCILFVRFFSRPAAIFPRVPLEFDGNTVLGDGRVTKVAPLDYLESKV